MRQIVKDNTDYEKDLYSGAIINRSRARYEAAQKRKSIAAEKEKEISDLKNQVNTLTALVEKLIEEKR